MGNVRIPARERVFRVIRAAGSEGASREEIVRGARPMRQRPVEEMIQQLSREGLILENPQEERKKRWRISSLPAPADIEEEMLRLIKEGTDTPAGLMAALDRPRKTIANKLITLIEKKQIVRIKHGLYGTRKKTDR